MLIFQTFVVGQCSSNAYENSQIIDSSLLFGLTGRLKQWQ